MTQPTSSISSHALCTSSLPRQSDDIINNNLTRVFQVFHKTLQRALTSTDRKNTKRLERAKVYLLYRKDILYTYLEAHNNFKQSLRVLLNLKTAASAGHEDSAIQDHATQADVKDFIRNLLILIEWNYYFEKIPQHTIEIKPQQAGETRSRIYVDDTEKEQDEQREQTQDKQRGHNRTPSLFHPKEWGRYFSEPPFQQPTLAETANNPALKSQSSTYERKDDHVAPPTPPIPDDRNSADLIIHPTTLTTDSTSFKLQSYTFPRDPSAFERAVETHPSCQPIPEFCTYKVDLWYITELVRFSTQMWLIENVNREPRVNGQFFALYKDTTIFQGRSPIEGQSAAHMNFRPQTCDLIAYKILQNIAKTQTATDAEKTFLSCRKIWRKNESVEDMCRLSQSFNAFIENTGNDINSDKFYPLNLERFILISSIFARTHFEAASNATCYTSGYSNALDTDIETPMRACLHNWQKELLKLPDDKQKVEFGAQKKDKPYPRKRIPNNEKLNSEWRSNFKKIPSKHAEYPEDRLEKLTKQTNLLTSKLIKTLYSFTEAVTEGTSLYNDFRNTARQKESGIGDYINIFMICLEPVLSVQSNTVPTEFQQLKRVLDEVFKEIESDQTTLLDDYFQFEQQALETPEILKLEQDVIELRLRQLELELLIKRNASITDANIGFMISQFQKNPLEAITAYDPTLPPDPSVEIGSPLRERRLHKNENMETIYVEDMYMYTKAQHQHIPALINKFKAVVPSVPPISITPSATTSQTSNQESEASNQESEASNQELPALYE